MKLTKIIGFYLIVNTILLIGISSCTKNSETLQAEIPLSDSTCMANVTYSQNIKPIINTTCAISGCHVSNGFKDFSTYTALKDELDTKGTAYFLSRIKSGGGMPPSYTTGPKSISDCDYNKIEAWLNQNYPNN